MRKRTTHYVLSWILAVAIMLSAISPSYTVLAQTGEEGGGAPQGVMTVLRDTAEEPEAPEVPEVPEEPETPEKPEVPQRPETPDKSKRGEDRDSGAARISVPFGMGIGLLSVRAPQDQTHLFIDSGKTPPEARDEMLTIKVKIGGVYRDLQDIVDEGLVLNLDDELDIQIVFKKIPVAGDPDIDPDAEDTYILQGDSVLFALGDGFKLFGSDTAERALLFNGMEVANATLKNIAGNAHVEVLFDGEDDVFNGEAYGVHGDFTARLKYEGDAVRDPDGYKTVMLLGKEYRIKQPDITFEYTMTKAGSVHLDSGIITWTVVVDAYEEGKPASHISLQGYEFSDLLTDVGDYVPGSFKVGASESTAAVPVPGAVWDGTGKKLTYTFGDVPSPRTVTFSTYIKDAQYHDPTRTHTVRNTAKLLDSGEEVAEKAGTVSFKPDWITKEGTVGGQWTDGTYNPTDRTITWTIIANKNGAALNGVTITDVLTGLDFESAQWWKLDENGNRILPPTSHPDPGPGGVYTIGNITTPIELEIITGVPDAPGSVTGETDYPNTATIAWITDGRGKPGPAGGVSGTGEVGVGYSSITKSGTREWPTRNINWTVTVNPAGQNITEMKVYDLLAYGPAGAAGSFDPAALIDNAGDIPAGLAFGTGANEVRPRYGQQYVDSSFNAVPALTFEHIVIKQGGKPVADLLVVGGFDANASRAFTFKTEVTDPAVFAADKNANSGSEAAPLVYNTAALYRDSGGLVKLGEATADVRYRSSLLRKEMLQRGADPADYNQVNSQRTTTAGDGFNYDDNSVVYRLVVNPDSLDFTDSGPERGPIHGIPGDVVVTDTLPEGWEFVSLTDDPDGPKYYIYEATRSTDDPDATSVTANATDSLFGLPPADQPPLAAAVVFGQDGTGKKTATFTFAGLNTPYVILVKGRPTDETLKGYFEGNPDAGITRINSLKLTKSAWGIDIGPRTQSVLIGNRVLDKGYALPSDGILEWTVDYKPRGVHLGNQIVDTLSPSLALRTDAQGNLDLTSVWLYKLKVSGTGYVTDGGAMPLSQGGPVIRAYDETTARDMLIFNIPQTPVGQAYRLIYLTDIIGDPGDDISNEVELVDGDITAKDRVAQFSVRNADASASMRRNGSLTLRKLDEVGDPLNGAEFSLYNDARQEPPLKKLTVDAEGIIRGIGPGSYWLKETAAPAGYILPPDRWYRVVVAETVVDGLTWVITSVDGVEMTVNGFGIPPAAVVNNPKEIINFPLTGPDRTNLRFEKQVISDDPADLGGTAAPTEFAFTVAFTPTGGGAYATAHEYTRYGSDGHPVGTGMMASGDTLRVKADEYIVIHDLPVGLDYSITETAVYNGGELDDYLTLINDVQSHTREGSGTLDAIGDSPTVTFLNIRLGALVIRKTVEVDSGANGAIDPDQAFTFTLTLEDADNIGYPTTLQYDYFITEAGTPPAPGATPDGAVGDGDTVTLKHNRQVTVAGLPQGIRYEVVENDYQAHGYTSAYDSGPAYKAPEGDIAGNQTVHFINTQFWYDLTVEKTVAHPLGLIDTEKEFEFTLTLKDEDGVGFDLMREYPLYLRGSGDPDWVPAGNIQSGETFTLRHGQRARVAGLPRGIGYQVDEANYSSAGYIPPAVVNDAETGEGSTKAEGSMSRPTTLRFTNTQLLEGLTIHKRVTGNAASTSRQFAFTVTLTGAGDGNEYAYTVYNASGAPVGAPRSLVSGDTVLLSHEQYAVIEDLPVGLSYKVEEASYSAEGYTTTSTDEEGVISSEDAVNIVTFTNRRHHRPHRGDPEGPGGGSGASRETGLTVQKTVTGEEARRDQAFTFVVTFDADGAYRYTGSKSGTLSSGDRITLAHGESIRILGLPTGANYQVTEVEANQDGYYSTNTGASGRVTASDQTAAFINAKGVPFVPPNTGDATSNLLARLALLGSTVLLGALARADYMLRKRYPKSKGAA